MLMSDDLIPHYHFQNTNAWICWYMRLHMWFVKDMRIMLISAYINKRIMGILKITAHMKKTATAYAHIRMKPHNPVTAWPALL